MLATLFPLGFRSDVVSVFELVRWYPKCNNCHFQQICFPFLSSPSWKEEVGLAVYCKCFYLLLNVSKPVPP